MVNGGSRPATSAWFTTAPWEESRASTRTPSSSRTASCVCCRRTDCTSTRNGMAVRAKDMLGALREAISHSRRPGRTTPSSSFCSSSARTSRSTHR
ncbi:hypothetical protein GY12_04675 [Micrococcus luteus]|nr:hypothetical protein GY12_04675 [Micrococcus luteus]